MNTFWAWFGYISALGFWLVILWFILDAVADVGRLLTRKREVHYIFDQEQHPDPSAPSDFIPYATVQHFRRKR